MRKFLVMLVVLGGSLVTLLQASVSAQNQPVSDDEAIARGREVFAQIRCTSCHTLNGEGTGTAVELSTAGHRLAYLMNQNGLSQAEAMESIFAGPPQMRLVRTRLSDDQAADVAAYVATFLGPLEWDEYTPQEAVDGMQAFARAGCVECHTVAGVGGTDRDEPIALQGVRLKQSQLVELQKLAHTGGGPRDPARTMANLWSATSDDDKRLILAFVHQLD